MQRKLPRNLSGALTVGQYKPFANACMAMRPACSAEPGVQCFAVQVVAKCVAPAERAVVPFGQPARLDELLLRGQHFEHAVHRFRLDLQRSGHARRRELGTRDARRFQARLLRRVQARELRVDQLAQPPWHGGLG